MTMRPLPPFPDPADPVWPALDRYLAGQGTADDFAAVARWESVDVARQDAIRRWKGAWAQMTAGATPSETDVRRVAREIVGGRREFPKVHGGGHAVRVGKAGFGTRALRKGMAGLGFQALNDTQNSSRRSTPRDSNAASVHVRASASRTRPWQIGAAVIAAVTAIVAVARIGSVRHPGITKTYTTTTGHRAAFQLVDGTRVTLGPQSSLAIEDFGEQSRTVRLQGEAYFETVSSSGAPFTVQAGSVATRVLGTAFLVRHYSSDPRVHVSVTIGKVSVTAQAMSRPSVVLAAGRAVDITDSTITVSTVQNIREETGWLGDELVFRNAPVTRVLATLTRWYGYEFRVTDSTITQQNVTLWLNARLSSKALSTLKRVLDVDVTVRGDTVTLTPTKRHDAHGERLRGYDVFTPVREAGR
jgi:ferric-dicitrate binding protein FerR (iron transport regulator)